jgi:hypothetical protein
MCLWASYKKKNNFFASFTEERSRVRSFGFGSGAGSNSQSCGSDPHPKLRTQLLSSVKDAKKLFFSIFFSYNLPTGTLFSVLKI